MKKKNLEILLEKVAGFPAPSLREEQYITPAPIAAELLFFAYLRKDLVDAVYDLGCGTGTLGIGAKLLGVEKVIGFDRDIAALKIARKNAEKLGVDVEFVCCDVADVCGHCHTVVMNPPFGAQIKGRDRPFLRKALEVSDVIYTIHNAGSRDFIQKFISPSIITDQKLIDLPIKRTFKFHKKNMEIVKAEIYRIESKLRD